MHWQQYVTLVGGCIGVVVGGFGAVCRLQPEERINAFLAAVAVGFGQFVLWSGGWYGN